MKEISFVAAMKEHFGLKEGQTLQQFAIELKTLTNEDRDYFRRELEVIGYTLTPKAEG